jgi:hypothetical protein
VDPAVAKLVVRVVKDRVQGGCQRDGIAGIVGLIQLGGRSSQDALAGCNSVKDAEVYQHGTISNFMILSCVFKTNIKFVGTLKTRYSYVQALSQDKEHDVLPCAAT